MGFSRHQNLQPKRQATICQPKICGRMSRQLSRVPSSVGFLNDTFGLSLDRGGGRIFRLAMEPDDSVNSRAPYTSHPLTSNDSGLYWYCIQVRFRPAYTGIVHVFKFEPPIENTVPARKSILYCNTTRIFISQSIIQRFICTIIPAGIIGKIL